MNRGAISDKKVWKISKGMAVLPKLQRKQGGSTAMVQAPDFLCRSTKRGHSRHIVRNTTTIEKFPSVHNNSCGVNTTQRGSDWPVCQIPSKGIPTIGANCFAIPLEISYTYNWTSKVSSINWNAQLNICVIWSLVTTCEHNELSQHAPHVSRDFELARHLRRISCTPHRLYPQLR